VRKVLKSDIDMSVMVMDGGRALDSNQVRTVMVGVSSCQAASPVDIGLSARISIDESAAAG
jgi:hypothetical protein